MRRLHEHAAVYDGDPRPHIEWSADELRRLIEEGLNFNDMAKRYDRNSETIIRAIRGAGLRPFYDETRRARETERTFAGWRRQAAVPHPRKHPYRFRNIEAWIQLYSQAIAGGFKVKLRYQPHESTIEGARIRLTMHGGAPTIIETKGRVYRYLTTEVQRPWKFNVILLPNGQWLFLLPVMTKPTRHLRLKPLEVFEARWWPTPLELRTATEQVDAELAERN